MKRVLVVRLSALGDVIHTIPAVVGLSGKVTWVVEAPYRELVEVVAGVEAVPVRMKAWGKSLWRSRGEMREALRAMHADEAIDFQGLMKSAALPWLARVPKRYGFAEPRERLARLAYNERVAVDTSKHVVEQNVQLALRSAAAELPLSDAQSGSARCRTPKWREFAKGGEQYQGSIVLLPGAGKSDKLWPVARFRELAKRIGERAVVVWGPGERHLAEQIEARMAPPTNLRELAGILAHARVVIGADTGPLHLAAALGTKVLGLYGPTNPRRNGPYGQLDHVVDKFVTTKLMESITVEEVTRMLDRLASE